MENRRKTTFLGENFNDLSRQGQEYIRNLIRSLFQLQNSGPRPTAENPSADSLPTAGGAGMKRGWRAKGQEGGT
jgi:hypothetical protein